MAAKVSLNFLKNIESVSSNTQLKLYLYGNKQNEASTTGLLGCGVVEINNLTEKSDGVFELTIGTVATGDITQSSAVGVTLGTDSWVATNFRIYDGVATQGTIDEFLIEGDLSPSRIVMSGDTFSTRASSVTFTVS